ncbi:non-canonical purine NTP diphosphatase [Flavobacterium sp.]|uniref:non-canonical purine NTP diphosphatase n=1 Tax=Flavobacterium sp. TaxID=239 RepID=UPI003D124764
MKIVFASNNKNKINEIQQMLPKEIEILSLEDIKCFVDIPETATTIEGNAQLKANYITENFGYTCFADDSGLEVNPLDGAPGVHSARYAGEEKDDVKNIEKLLTDLKPFSNAKANFKTVICLNLNGQQHLFTGIVNGEIIKQPRGTQGFGYDPVFVPEGFENTFAEMTMEEKAIISHRGKAVKQLIDFLTKMQFQNS